MVRKRIPLITHPDQAYASSLPQQILQETPPAPEAEQPAERHRQKVLTAAPSPLLSHPGESGGNSSVQIDVRVTALASQETGLLTCGIAPRQVIRAALRKAVKKWTISALYSPAPAIRRARPRDWTVRTSIAVPAAIFDRLLVEQDPLGVDSRWSLIRGQLEPLVWAEIDALLASFNEDGTV